MPLFTSSRLHRLMAWAQRQRGLRTGLRWFCYLYAGWFLLCTLVLNPALNYAAGKLYQAQTGRQLHYDHISFNPFTLNLRVVNAYDRNPDQSLFWKLQRADVDLALWRSLVNLAPGLDALSVKGVEVYLALSATGALTIDDILQHRLQLASSASTSAPPIDEAPADAGTSDALFPFFIHQARLHIHRIHYREARPRGTFSQAINDIELNLERFSTRSETGQPYRLFARLGDQGSVALTGDLSLASSQLQGKLQLEALPLQPFAEYWQDALAVHLRSGQLAITGDYKLDWREALRYQLANGQLALQYLALQGQDPNDLQLQLAQLALVDVSLDSDSQQLHIAHTSLDQPQLASWSKGAELGLFKALGISGDERSTSSHTEAPEPTAPWDIRIDKLALREGDIRWALAELDNRNLHIQHLNLEATPLVLSGAADTGFTLSAKAEGAPLNIAGQVNPASLNGQLDLQVQQLPLGLANSQLAAFIAGEITQGTLNTHAQITLAEGAPTHIQTSGSIDEFVLSPFSREEALRFSQLAWADTRVDMSQQQLHLPQVKVSGLDGRFMINKAGTTNLDALLVDQPQAVTDTDTTEDTQGWGIHLDKLELDNASFRFNDASLTPQFTAAVQNFSGELTGLSSDTRTRAKFLFKGNVDGYAPVSLQGQAQPFLPEPMVQAELQFKHLDLGGLSTYSSTYAGWRIERGQLTADLNYHLEDGRILGDNHIEMDKLQLGERVRSTQAMDIPIRLALAMITDSNGLAVLDMQVKGNTQDPQFDLSKIIVSALKNTLKKIVTAPFRLLASLVKSDEELEILPFNSGSQNILATANRRLDALHNALNQRPLLNIDLQGRYDPVSDTRGLQIVQANNLLLGDGLTGQDIKQKNSRWESAVKKYYLALPDNHGNSLSADSMFESWIATLPVDNAELQQLAVNRASTAKQHLVQKFGIDPARVFINSSSQCKEENPAECRRRAVKLALHNTWDLSSQGF